ncbi:MAG: accessory factor UbiK family protein [Allosphingosinicella sp.]|uniref:accessory factor UbiK family protein n=1 Tax=Allosphingosinicella sp. TaxID=2823234 RepID=UPI003962C6D1
MQSENRLFDDFVRVLNGAAGTVAGMTREAESAFRERTREWIGGLDMVSRDEFEAVKAMAVAARDEVEALRARVQLLEAALEAKSGAGASARKGAGTAKE